MEALDLTLDDGVKVLEADGGEGEEVEGAEVVAEVEGRDVVREVGAETLVDVFGEEGDEGGLSERGLACDSKKAVLKKTHESSGESEESLEERLEGGHGVLGSVLSLEPSAVEANVPVRKLVDQVEHTTNDGVEAVRCE